MKILVHVTPNAKHESILIEENLLGEKIYKVKLRAKPVDGEANKALIGALAKYFDLPKRHIIIEKGQTSRRKIVTVSGLEIGLDTGSVEEK